MKEKTILFIHKGYPLGTEAGDKIRTLNMATSMLQQGYQVILLGFVTRRLHLIRKEKRKIPVGIKSIFLFTLPNRFGLTKLAAFFRAVAAFFICRIYAIDIIQAELASSAMSARFVPYIPLITDFHSDTVPELEMNALSTSHLKQAATENKFAIENSLKTITVSDRLEKNLSVYSGNEFKKNYILPCNFSEVPFLQLEDNIRMQMRKKYNLEDRIVLCYSGGLHKWQCIEETLELAKRLMQINSRYYFCFFTKDNIASFKEKLEQLGESYMVKGLNFEDIPVYLSMIDIGFLLRRNSLVNINSSPTKTAEYMAAGAMIITTQYAGDAPELIRQSGYGIILDEPDINDKQLMELNTRIEKYLENYEVESQKAKNYVFKNRTWSFNEQKLKELYQDI